MKWKYKKGDKFFKRRAKKGLALQIKTKIKMESKKLQETLEKRPLKNNIKSIEKTLNGMWLNPKFKEQVSKLLRELRANFSEVMAVSPIIKEENDKFFSLKKQRCRSFDTNLNEATTANYK